MPSMLDGTPSMLDGTPSMPSMLDGMVEVIRHALACLEYLAWTIAGTNAFIVHVSIPGDLQSR